MLIFFSGKSKIALIYMIYFQNDLRKIYKYYGNSDLIYDMSN
jgi:hypothetical protein